ncbi:MAG: hypothetical protein RL285_1478 [Bacteroidota bacterium]
MPINRIPVEKEPIRKYFNAASLLLRFDLSLPASTYNGIETISIPMNNINNDLNPAIIEIPAVMKKINA